MITAVDSNVLIDIIRADKIFGPGSAKALEHCLQDGTVVACGAVLVETMVYFPTTEIFFETLSILLVQPVIISMPAFIEASSVWREYRRLGGSRNRVMADFLIGAHALVECDRLLTRDRGFYRQYFKKLKIVEPKMPAK